MSAQVRLGAGDVSVVVELAHGARLASLTVDGYELLIGDPARGVLEWGCYPMAPFAGRLRHGVFMFEGHRYELPRNLPPHAIHGSVFDATWSVEDDGVFVAPLRAPWPFPGRVVQRVAVSPDAVSLTLEVHADDAAMPASCGWHPWWRRPVTLAFAADAMWQRDAEGIPSGELVAPPPGPWDDCFTGVHAPPVLRFEGGPTMAIESSCEHLVVYDERDDAVCVEPQTGPPDALNLAPFVVEPGRPLVARMALRFS